MKQNTLNYEWNSEKDGIDFLWIIQTEDGKFYQSAKFISGIKIRKLLEEDGWEIH